MLIRFHGLTLRIEVERPDDAAWLYEFLAPPARLLPSAGDIAPDRKVRLSIDPARHADLLASPHRAQAIAVCVFIQDRAIIEHQAWREPSGHLVIHDAEYGACYVRDDGNRSIDIVYDRATPWARVALMRVVRELGAGRAAAEGALLLHAAAALVGEHAVLIVGPKRSGKTSLLLHLLKGHGTALCANDRCLVLLDGDRPAVAAMPTVVSIRPGSFAQLPRRAALRSTSDAPLCMTLDEWLDRPVLQTCLPDTPLLLSPAQLGHLTRRPRRGGGRLGSMVFPGVTADVQGFALRPLDPASAVRRLHENLFSAQTPPQTLSLLSDIAAERLPDAEAINRSCASLVERVPCFECLLGKDAYADPAAESLIAALSEICAAPM